MDEGTALLKERVDAYISELASLVKQDNPEALSEYLNDCWDIEVTYNLQGQFNGLSLVVAIDGPNIYITCHRCQPWATINGSWGGSHYQDYLNTEISQALWEEGEHLAELAEYAIQHRLNNPRSHAA